ncbi:hypothetical protein GCM10009799_23550 [Nocardiopsis rhodophaea]|uniref:Uncharacterized protein n=1 Tax=Nocardiopsis rhodophaea TaxID=280238 RepID=A0ABN2T106_9ACTN
MGRRPRKAEKRCNVIQLSAGRGENEIEPLSRAEIIWAPAGVSLPSGHSVVPLMAILWPRFLLASHGKTDKSLTMSAGKRMAGGGPTGPPPAITHVTSDDIPRAGERQPTPTIGEHRSGDAR